MLMALRCAFRGFGSLAGLTALLPVLLAAAGAPALAAPRIAPHIAIYKLSLGKSTGGQAVTHANGRIEFKWSEGCDGWTISQRTLMVLSNSQGRNLQSSWTLDAWESKDGLSYRFAVRRAEGGHDPVETRGKARLDGPNLGGRVDYSAPEERMVLLPKGTVFPTRHSLDVLAAAEGRELLLWRTVFDGTGAEGLFGVNAAVAQAIPEGTAPSFDSPLIAGVQSWRMRFAYFDVDQQTAEPDHEQALRIYANGVVDELEFDYSDFALEASLERLEALPSPDCS
jgi:hypothetical protein